VYVTDEQLGTIRRLQAKGLLPATGCAGARSRAHLPVNRPAADATADELAGWRQQRQLSAQRLVQQWLGAQTAGPPAARSPVRRQPRTEPRRGYLPDSSRLSAHSCVGDGRRVRHGRMSASAEAAGVPVVAHASVQRRPHRARGDVRQPRHRGVGCRGGAGSVPRRWWGRQTRRVGSFTAAWNDRGGRGGPRAAARYRLGSDRGSPNDGARCSRSG